MGSRSERAAELCPASGTPAQTVFGGFVDFSAGSSGTNQSIELESTDVVTYRFSGLDPARRYRFIGTAIRGVDSYTNRWTSVEMTGAMNYSASHTPGVLTSNQVPSLRASLAALNTGRNHTADSGDFVGWVGIQPSLEGTFTLVCRQYTGPVPGGAADGLRSYALTGLSLEAEPDAPQPPRLVRQPVNVFVVAGGKALLQAAAFGAGPLVYQWRHDLVPVPGATNPELRIDNPRPADQGFYDVVVTAPDGSVTSRAAELTLVEKPFLITPPSPQTNVVVEGGSATFIVEAGGTLPLSYLWQKNGVILSRLTLNSHVSLVTLSNVPYAPPGRVQVTVTNLFGAVPASFPVWLVVMHDSDLDGVGDEWELGYGLDPANPKDALLDRDGDGLSSLEEFQADTDPTSAASTLRLQIPELDSGDKVVLRFEAAPHKSYRLQSVESLGSAGWETVSSVGAALERRMVTLTNTPIPFGVQRFYRLQTPAWP